MKKYTCFSLHTLSIKYENILIVTIFIYCKTEHKTDRLNIHVTKINLQSGRLIHT